MDLLGIYGGLVEDNKDPQKQGRLKVRVPHAYGAVGGAFGAVTTNDIPWALPAGLPNGQSQQSGGADWLPGLGDVVWVMFLDCEPEKPIWFWGNQSQAAVNNFPLHTYSSGPSGSVGAPKRGAWVRYGHTVEWNTDGLIVTTSKGYRLLLTDASSVGNDGDILLATQAGQSLEFDDSTGDTTLNVNNNFNINVTTQILALADSFSLQTQTNEIELISGSELTIDTETDLSATVGEDFSLKVTGTSTLDLTDDLTIKVANNIDITATLDATLKTIGDMSLEATGTLDLNSTGVMTVKSAVAMNFDFLQLSLGSGASSPFVLGDQLFAYLQAMFTILVGHVHPGVFPGPSSTGPMTPTLQPPTPSLLSTVIKGK